MIPGTPGTLLPNFFIVGAPKTGTTSLYNYLRQHPGIYMSPVKEPCYFASEVRLDRFAPEFADAAAQSARDLKEYLRGPMHAPHGSGFVSEWPEYLRLFRNVASEKAIGEASACYLWSGSAARRIHARVPSARIIMILRDPVERAFSQYLHYTADGLIRRSFREHMKQCMSKPQRQFNPHYPFLEYGLYYEQVKRYLETFAREQIRIDLYEDAWRNPAATLLSLFAFLNVEAEFNVDFSQRARQRRAPRARLAHSLLRSTGVTHRMRRIMSAPLRAGLRKLYYAPSHTLKMDPHDRRYLQDYYREDILKLAGLLDRDLGSWLGPA